MTIKMRSDKKNSSKRAGSMAKMPNMKARVAPCKPVPYGSAELLGFAELIIGDCFVVRDIHILRMCKDGQESTFVSFPSRKWNDGNEFYDKAYLDLVEESKQSKNFSREELAEITVAFPITADSYRKSTALLLKTYREQAAKKAI